MKIECKVFPMSPLVEKESLKTVKQLLGRIFGTTIVEKKEQVLMRALEEIESRIQKRNQVDLEVLLSVLPVEAMFFCVLNDEETEKSLEKMGTSLRSFTSLLFTEKMHEMLFTSVNFVQHVITLTNSTLSLHNTSQALIPLDLPIFKGYVLGVKSGTVLLICLAPKTILDESFRESFVAILEENVAILESMVRDDKTLLGNLESEGLLQDFFKKWLGLFLPELNLFWYPLRWQCNRARCPLAGNTWHQFFQERYDRRGSKQFSFRKVWYEFFQQSDSTNQQEILEEFMNLLDDPMGCLVHLTPSFQKEMARVTRKEKALVKERHVLRLPEILHHLEELFHLFLIQHLGMTRLLPIHSLTFEKYKLQLDGIHSREERTDQGRMDGKQESFSFQKMLEMFFPERSKVSEHDPLILLISGIPGIGKTSCSLQLALHALQRVKLKQSLYLPMWFNCALPIHRELLRKMVLASSTKEKLEIALSVLLSKPIQGDEDVIHLDVDGELDAYQLLLILDGWNESPLQHDETFINVLTQQPATIVFSRPGSLSPFWSSERKAIIEQLILLPFSKQEAMSFLAEFGSLEKQDASRLVSLVHEILGDDGLIPFYLIHLQDVLSSISEEDLTEYHLISLLMKSLIMKSLRSFVRSKLRDESLQESRPPPADVIEGFLNAFSESVLKWLSNVYFALMTSSNEIKPTWILEAQVFDSLVKVQQPSVPRVLQPYLPEDLHGILFEILLPRKIEQGGRYRGLYHELLVDFLLATKMVSEWNPRKTMSDDTASVILSWTSEARYEKTIELTCQAWKNEMSRIKAWIITALKTRDASSDHIKAMASLIDILDIPDFFKRVKFDGSTIFQVNTANPPFGVELVYEVMKVIKSREITIGKIIIERSHYYALGESRKEFIEEFHAKFKDHLFLLYSSHIKITMRRLILGSSAAGSSSLRQRLHDGSFSSRPLMTIGSDFSVIKVSGQYLNLILQSWDLSGPKAFDPVTSVFIEGASLHLIVIDSGSIDINYHSSTFINKFISELVRYFHHVFNAPGYNFHGFIVVMNKIDLLEAEQRKEIRKLGLTVARQLLSHVLTSEGRVHVHYVETSAKTGEGIRDLMKAMLMSVPISYDVDEMIILEPNFAAKRISPTIQFNLQALDSMEDLIQYLEEEDYVLDHEGNRWSFLPKESPVTRMAVHVEGGPPWRVSIKRIKRA